MLACVQTAGAWAAELSGELQRWVEQAPVITVGVIADNEPYSSVEGGEVSGFSIDVLNEVAARTGLKLRYRAANWPELYASFLRGEIDVIDEISFRPDRAERMQFTAPYHERKTIVMHDAEHPLPELKSLSDLRPYRIGVVRDIYYKGLLVDNGVQVVEYDGLTSLVRALAFGWVDGIVGPEVTLQYLARRGGFAKLKLAGRVPMGGMEVEDFRLAVLRDRGELLKVLSAGLAAIPAQEMEALLIRWRDDGGPLELASGPFRLSDAEARYIRRIGTVRVGFMRDYAPYSFMQGGKVQGMAVDLLQQIEDLTGLNTVTVSDRWAVLYDMLQRGEIDVLANFSDLPQRRDFTRTTNPYRIIPNVVFTRDADLMYREPADLKGLRIAFGESVYYEDVLKRYYGEDAVSFSSQQAMFAALAEGSVDVVLAALHNGQHWMRELHLSDVRIAGELKMEGIAEEDLRFAARPSLEPLVRIMNAAMAAIPSSEQRNIENRWLGSLGPVLSEARSSVSVNSAEQAFLASRLRRLSVCVDQDWMPLLGVTANQRLEGIVADFMARFAERSKIAFDVVVSDNWEGSLAALEQQRCDVLPMAISTPERQQSMNFSAPYYSVPLVLLARVETPFLDSFTDLSGEKVGVVRGQGFATLLKARYPRIEFVEMESERVGLRAVQKGEVYGFVGALVSTSHQLHELGLADIKVIARVPSDMSFALATRIGAPELASIAQKWVESLTEQDRREIEMRWRAVSLEERVDYRLLWQLGIAASVLMLLLVAWNRKLGKLNERLEAANVVLEHMALTDSLTGVGNRQYMHKHFEPLFSLCQRYGQVFWIAILDVDLFKGINDTYGHQVGDECLKTLAQCLRQHARRQTDHVVRFGGEEFVAFGVVSESGGVEEWVEKLRATIEAQEIKGPKGQRVKMTISIGWAALVPGNELTAMGLMKAVDAALYQAKQQGRNCCVQVAKFPEEVKTRSQSLSDEKLHVMS